MNDQNLEELGLNELYVLDEGALQQFRTDGWTSLPGLLGAEVVGAILHRLDDSGGQVEPTETERWMIAGDYQRVLRMQDGMAWKDDWFKSLALSPRLVDLALTLIGSDDGLFIHDMSFFKPGDDGGATPFHQDFPHWPFDRSGAFTIWIALTDLSEDMGPLRFLPGSHVEGPRGRFSRGVGDDMCEAYPELKSRYAPVGGHSLRAGDATVHVDLMIHGSAGNTTGRERAAYTLRYMPSDVLYTGAPHRHFDGFGLAPGEPFTSSDRVPHISRPMS